MRECAAFELKTRIGRRSSLGRIAAALLVDPARMWVAPMQLIGLDRREHVVEYVAPVAQHSRMMPPPSTFL